MKLTEVSRLKLTEASRREVAGDDASDDELPEQQCLCPVDGTPMPAIRYEVSEQLDYEPSKISKPAA